MIVVRKGGGDAYVTGIGTESDIKLNKIRLGRAGDYGKSSLCLEAKVLKMLLLLITL